MGEYLVTEQHPGEEITELLQSSTTSMVFKMRWIISTSNSTVHYSGGQNEEGQRLDGILVFDGILSIWGSTKDMPTVNRPANYLTIFNKKRAIYIISYTFFPCVSQPVQVRIRAAAAQLGRYLYVAGGQKDRHTLNEVIR